MKLKNKQILAKALGISVDEITEHMVINNTLSLPGKGISELPDNLTIHGFLDLADTNIQELPENLIVNGYLDLSRSQIKKLPNNLQVNNSLDLSHTDIEELPDNLTIHGFLDLAHSRIKKLPTGLRVNGFLDITDTSITELPDDIDISDPIYLDPDNFPDIVASKRDCGRYDRTIHAIRINNQYRIMAGCFFDTIENFSIAVHNKYDYPDAVKYISDAQSCIDELEQKRNQHV